MTSRVLICDDEAALSADWVRRVRDVAPADRFEVLDAPTNEAIRDGVRTLIKRRNASRDGQAKPAGNCLFDGVDVLVVDYDLLHVDEENARYTGEGVARLARTFADCRIIIVLNQYPEAQFDLSLRGHLVSHGDLNLDAGLLDNAGLWTSPPWDGFRPWAWETADRSVDRRKAQIAALAGGGLKQSIVATLGMTAEDATRLSDGAFGFIAPDAGNFTALSEQTFEAFLATTTEGRDAHALVADDPTAAAQFAAARIGKWLERELLGPQDVLVDIPHLLQRFPFLVPGDLSDPAAWNAAIHDEAALKAVVPENAWFAAKDWLSRPAVWWRRVEADADIRKRRSEFDFTKAPDLAFLEDVSSFCPTDDATEFRAGFHNAYDRRFAKVVDGVRYAPQRRFAFGG